MNESQRHLRAVPAVEPPHHSEQEISLAELLAKPGGLDRLVSIVRDRVLDDPLTRRRLWEESLQDHDLFLELAELARSDPKMHLRMLALFGGGILSNTLMWAAEDAHCWRMDPSPERTTVHRPEQRARYNHESVDLRLQPILYFRPRGETIKLYDESDVLERMRNWPQRELSEDPDDPANIIEPGQSFVATADWLELPADCICPLTASIHTRSTHARLANFWLTPDCSRIKNGHKGRIYIEPTNGSTEKVALKRHQLLGALYLSPMSGRAQTYDSQYHGQH